MKVLMIASICTLFCSTLHSQTEGIVFKTFKSSYSESKDIQLHDNCFFTPITEIELYSKGFSRSYNGDKIAPNLSFASEPGYYQSGAMMSVTNMRSTIGNLKFNCNYYFDADGQLQDGDITISKVKK